MPTFVRINAAPISWVNPQYAKGKPEQLTWLDNFRRARQWYLQSLRPPSIPVIAFSFAHPNQGYNR